MYLHPKTPNSAWLQLSKTGGAMPLAAYVSGVLSTGKPVNRLALLTQMISEKMIEGVLFKEKSDIFPAYPLVMTIPIVEKNDLTVRFNNTNGEPFSGLLQLENITGLELVSTEPAPVRLKENEKHTTIRFPLKKKPSGSYSLSLSMKQDSEIMHLTPVQRFCTVDTFSPETFENHWKIVPDGDANVKSQQSLAIGTNGALKLTYQFDEGWKFLRLAPQNKAIASIEGKPQHLILYIDADGSGNTVRIRFTDSWGQTFQVNGDKMNEKGLQYFAFDVTGKNAHHWGGPNDGVVTYPIMFDSVIIDSSRKSTGTFEIDIFPLVWVFDD
jgi:hypothetical protein